MAEDPKEAKKLARAKLATVLRDASEQMLAEGDAEGARIAVEALKELRRLDDHPAEKR